MTNQKHTKVLLSEVHQTKSASFAELRNYDLEHYERISLIAHEWHAGVPRAIKFYRDESKSIADLRTQLTAVTKQRDELIQTLEKCTNCTAFGHPPNYESALLNLMHIAAEAVRKYKG